MFSCREIASQIWSSLTKPCSTSTRPSRRPLFFCCSSAAFSWSCEIAFCATRTSPRRIFSGRPMAVLRTRAARRTLSAFPPCGKRLPLPAPHNLRANQGAMQSFASRADLKPKTITFQRLSKNAYALTAEGDPNSGVIVGDDGVMVIDTQATPLMAREVIRRVRRVTAKPITYVVLTHYHAVRVLGASAYRAEQIIASRRTLGLIKERGRQDMASEIGRFPRLFRGAKS